MPVQTRANRKQMPGFTLYSEVRMSTHALVPTRNRYNDGWEVPTYFVCAAASYRIFGIASADREDNKPFLFPRATVLASNPRMGTQADMERHGRVDVRIGDAVIWRGTTYVVRLEKNGCDLRLEKK